MKFSPNLFELLRTGFCWVFLGGVISQETTDYTYTYTGTADLTTGSGSTVFTTFFTTDQQEAVRIVIGVNIAEVVVRL